MEFHYLNFRRLKTGLSQFDQTKPYSISNPLAAQMVLCSSQDGAPLKFNKKNYRASSLPGRII
jgi:hypothetical protein